MNEPSTWTAKVVSGTLAACQTVCHDVMALYNLTMIGTIRPTCPGGALLDHGQRYSFQATFAC